MSKLTKIYDTAVGYNHEAGLQAVWDAAIASAQAPTTEAPRSGPPTPEAPTPEVDITTEPPSA